MKKMKKSLTVMLCSLLIFSLLPFQAYAAAKPKAPAKVVASSTMNTVTLKWKKVKSAKGYAVYRYNAKTKKYKKIASTKKVKYTVKKLNPGTKYYFAVRAYDKKKKYSKYSKRISVKTKPQKKTEQIPVTTVNTAKTYQTIEGFGTSAAWWAHKVGGWENAEDIIKYLYSPVDGIGLNIYRYNVGAGSRNDEGIDGYWKRTDSFVKRYDPDRDTFYFDWSKDAEAQNALAIAKQLAGDDLRVTLFSNSPPVEITANGKAYCSYDAVGHYDLENKPTNISQAKYKTYAKFYTSVADHFIDEGYRVVDISPVNEPQYDWACDINGNMSQEGSHYGPIKLAYMLKEFVNETKEKPYKVSMFESGAAEGAGTNFDKYLDAVMAVKENADYFTSVSTHSYWCDKTTKQNCYNYLKSTYPNLSVACTEYCQMTGDRNTGVFEISEPIPWWDKARNGIGIEYGVQMARVIYEDMTVLNATEWDWWLGVSNGYYPDGLVYIDNTDEDHSVIETSKRLWCLGNYSKFIKEGAKRVDANNNSNNNILSSAYLNQDGSLVIVYVNTTSSSSKTTINANGYHSYQVYETSASKNLDMVKSGNYSSNTEINIPANSVVSVILTK